MMNIDLNMQNEEAVVVLPASFVPGKWDVICQRGKECYEHAGNKRFRMIISNSIEKYKNASSRREKSQIVSNIVNTISSAAANSSGGGFVRKDLLTMNWVRVSDKVAHEKVGQALRDARKTSKTPSNKKVVEEKPRRNIFQEHVMSFQMEPTPLMDMPMDQEPPITNWGPSSISAHKKSEISASTLLRIFDEDISGDSVMDVDPTPDAPSSSPLRLSSFNETSCIIPQPGSFSQMPFHPVGNSLLNLLSY